MQVLFFGTFRENKGMAVLIDAIAMSEGTYDAAKKAFTYNGESPDVMAGKYVESRAVETMTDADQWTMQYFTTGPDGKEFMSMEAHYSRAK